MANSLNILALSGSLRKGSFNTALLRAAQELAPEGVNINIYDYSNLPFYNQDNDGENAIEAVADFKKAIAEADALLIATPEYNYSIPGGLKNAIDWASRPPQSSPLNGKPTAIMGVSGGPGGTVRAQHHLRQVGVFTNLHILNKPEITVRMANDKFDADGHLTDEPTRQQVRALVEALAKWAVKLKD